MNGDKDTNKIVMIFVTAVARVRIFQNVPTCMLLTLQLTPKYQNYFHRVRVGLL